MSRTYLFLDPSRPLAFGQIGFDETYKSFSWETRRDLAGRLPELVDEMLLQAGKTIDDIEVLAACTGPGSLTGLRVGLSFFRTLSQITGKPLVGVDLFTWAAVTLRMSKKRGQCKLLVSAFMNHAFHVDLHFPLEEGWKPVPQLMELSLGVKAPKKSFGIRSENLGEILLEPSPEALHEILVRGPLPEFSFEDLLHVKPMYVIPSQPEIKFDQKLKG